MCDTKVGGGTYEERSIPKTSAYCGLQLSSMESLSQETENKQKTLIGL